MDFKCSVQISTMATLETECYELFYFWNLYERNEHFLNEITVENTTSIGTIYEFMMQNQRINVVKQDNKHRLEDFRNDLSLNVLKA